MSLESERSRGQPIPDSGSLRQGTRVLRPLATGGPVPQSGKLFAGELAASAEAPARV